MEVLGIVVLSAFAFYGIFLMIAEMLKKQQPKSYNAGFKIILAVSENAVENLEGIIREVFSENMPGKLMTDSRLYVVIPDGNPKIARIIEDLKKTYPIEVLPASGGYCMITDRSP
jgi:hypothetical protein